MTISSIPPVVPITPTGGAAQAQVPFEKPKPEPTPHKAPFQPAPPLRPDIQDTIAMDRALLALREV